MVGSGINIGSVSLGEFSDSDISTISVGGLVCAGRSHLRSGTGSSSWFSPGATEGTAFSCLSRLEQIEIISHE